MVLNKNGISYATIGVAFMVGFALLILAMGIAPALKEQVDTSRNPANMDCSNESISIFDKATCINVDASQFLFIGGLLFLGFAIIAGARRLF